MNRFKIFLCIHLAINFLSIPQSKASYLQSFYHLVTSGCSQLILSLGWKARRIPDYFGNAQKERQARRELRKLHKEFRRWLKAPNGQPPLPLVMELEFAKQLYLKLKVKRNLQLTLSEQSTGLFMNDERWTIRLPAGRFSDLNYSLLEGLCVAAILDAADDNKAYDFTVLRNNQKRYMKFCSLENSSELLNEILQRYAIVVASRRFYKKWYRVPRASYAMRVTPYSISLMPEATIVSNILGEVNVGTQFLQLFVTILSPLIDEIIFRN